MKVAGREHRKKKRIPAFQANGTRGGLDTARIDENLLFHYYKIDVVTTLWADSSFVELDVVLGWSVVIDVYGHASCAVAG